VRFVNELENCVCDEEEKMVCDGWDKGKRTGSRRISVANSNEKKRTRTKFDRNLTKIKRIKPFLK
jgi:hypothetical protein